jgi:hypothetical protein
VIDDWIPINKNSLPLTIIPQNDNLAATILEKAYSKEMKTFFNFK